MRAIGAMICALVGLTYLALYVWRLADPHHAQHIACITWAYRCHDTP
jgi:hypothetical protein